jgi:hypothetical protein
VGWALVLALGAAACATGAGASSFESDAGASTAAPPTSSGASSVTSSGASGPVTGNGGQLGSSVAGPQPTPVQDAAVHMNRCDDAGNCTCIAIASIGHEGVWGPCSDDTTTAFQDWLNTQSTARVDSYDTTKPTITPEFLSKYDVLVLQWMVTVGMQNDDGDPWAFTSDEVSALNDWVQHGGGIVALSGYQGDYPGAVVDITATNQLLSFTDIQFNQVVSLTQTMGNAGCWGSAVALGGPVGDGGTVPSVGTWDPSTPIGANVNSVGAYYTRTIQATTATTDCSATDEGGLEKYAVHEQIGQGHIVAYADEWVTYSGEWTGTGSCLAPYHMMDNSCYGFTPDLIFQIPQFWYNAIRYASSSVACFAINDPTIVVPR